MFGKEKVVKHRRMRVFCKPQCISDMFASRVHVFVEYKNALFPSICGLSISANKNDIMYLRAAHA